MILTQVAWGQLPGAAPPPSYLAPQLSSKPSQRVWLPDEPAECVAIDGDLLYLGGPFSQVAPHTGPFGALGVATSALTPGFPLLDASVYAVEPDGLGGWFLGGAFTRADEHSRRGLLHLDADGAVDSFQADVDGIVRALALNGNVLYVGGHFVSVAGEPRMCLAAIDASSGSVLPWDPAFGEPWNTEEQVADLCICGPNLVAGGSFERGFLGLPRRNLLSIDLQSGQPTPWNPMPDGKVWALDTQGSYVFAAGSFLRFAGHLSPFVAAVDPAVGNPLQLGLALNKSATAIGVDGDTLYLGGEFTSANGQPRQHTAALRWTDSTLLPWGPAVADDDGGGLSVLDIEVADSSVYLAGSFGTLSGVRRLCAAEVERLSGAVTAWTGDAAGPGATSVSCLALQGSAVAVGGNFLTLGGARRKGAARIDLRTGSLTAWDPEVLESPGSDEPGDVLAVVPSADGVFLGGKFRLVNQELRSHLALVDVTTGAPIGEFQPAPFHPSSDFVRLIRQVDRRLFIAGSFDLAGNTMYGLAALDPHSGLPLAGWECRTGSVYALAESDDHTSLFVGGAFDSIGPGGATARRNLAALESSSGVPLPWLPQPDGFVRALATRNGELIVGGGFGTIAGQARLRLAILDAASATAVSTILDIAGTGTTHVDRLALDGSNLYVGGVFATVAGIPRTNLASIDLDLALPTSWNPAPVLGPRDLALSARALAIAGGTDGLTQPHLSVYSIGW